MQPGGRLELVGRCFRRRDLQELKLGCIKIGTALETNCATAGRKASRTGSRVKPGRLNRQRELHNQFERPESRRRLAHLASSLEYFLSKMRALQGYQYCIKLCFSAEKESD